MSRRLPRRGGPGAWGRRLGAVLLAAFGLAAAAAEPPVALDADGFREVLARDGDVYLAGQPDGAGLARARALGVTTIVSLRTAGEMNDRSTVPFDEAALVRALGMRYVHVPAGGDAAPFSPAQVKRVAEVIDAADGPVLVHCATGRRATHLWEALLHAERGLALDEAVARGRAVNFGTLPLEGFLGKPVTFASPDDTAEAP